MTLTLRKPYSRAYTNNAEIRQEGIILKRLFVFVVVLVLLAVLVSSVSADTTLQPPVNDRAPSGTVSLINTDPDDPDPVVRGAVLVADVTLNPPPGSDVDPDTKATPVLF